MARTKTRGAGLWNPDRVNFAPCGQQQGISVAAKMPGAGKFSTRSPLCLTSVRAGGENVEEKGEGNRSGKTR